MRRRHTRWSKNNAQATRAESARTVLIGPGHPETEREPAFTEGVTTSGKFKVRRFWRGVMRPPAPVRSGAARGRVGAFEWSDIRLRGRLYSLQGLRSIL